MTIARAEETLTAIEDNGAGRARSERPGVPRPRALLTGLLFAMAAGLVSAAPREDGNAAPSAPASVSVSAPGSATAPGPQPQPEEARMRAIVERLASPEFQGRSGAGAVKAAEFLASEFRQLHLKGAFAGDFFQPVPGKGPNTTIGRNVAAVLPGADGSLRDQWVIVSAHFDHLGVHEGRLYPGADDNASGVAMMLEVARSIVEAPAPPKRSVLFVGFDLEEAGLFGSRYFAAHPPVPLDHVALFVTADMIGRSLAGVCQDYVFVLGSEHAPAVRPWIAEAGRGLPLSIGVVGADLLVLNRSDYGPFRSRKVPFLFFTTGENPCYHTPQDVPDTLDYRKMTAIARLIHRALRSAIDAPDAPEWRDVPDNPIGEAVAIRNVFRRLVEHRTDLKIGAAPMFVIKNTLALLDEIVARGTITPEERARVVQGAQIVLFTVL